jgi:hypothetical protein
LLDGHAVAVQVLAPSVEVVGLDPQGEMARPAGPVRRQRAALPRGLGPEGEQHAGPARLKEDVMSGLGAEDGKAQDRAVKSFRGPKILDVDGGFDNGLDLHVGLFPGGPVRTPSSRTWSRTVFPDTALHGHHSIRYCSSSRIFVRASSREEAETSTVPRSGLMWRTRHVPLGVRLRVQGLSWEPTSFRASDAGGAAGARSNSIALREMKDGTTTHCQAGKSWMPIFIFFCRPALTSRGRGCPIKAHPRRARS